VISIASYCFSYIKGELEGRLGNLPSAIADLQSSVELYDLLQNGPYAYTTGDRRALYSALANLGSMLCFATEYVEGLHSIQKAITEESRHVGEFHHNLAEKFTRAGICAYEAYQSIKSMTIDSVHNIGDQSYSKVRAHWLNRATKYFGSAVDIFQKNVDIPFNNLIAIVQEYKILIENSNKFL